jgi:surface antigen
MVRPVVLIDWMPTGRFYRSLPTINFITPGPPERAALIVFPFRARGEGMMRSMNIAAVVLAFALCTIPAQAHEILARGATETLTPRDRQAAARAEQEALERDEPVRNFIWQGPDGASGVIIVSGQYPDFYGMGRCRNLVHVIRHLGDGGVNPTFEAKVCRNWEGQWRVEKP